MVQRYLVLAEVQQSFFVPFLWCCPDLLPILYSLIPVVPEFPVKQSNATVCC